jgi:TPR repeat protein
MIRSTATGGITAVLLVTSFAISAKAAIGDSLVVAQSGKPEAAFSRFRVRAATGDSNAQIYLGELYRHGLDITWDAHKAFGWHLKAAQQGNITGLSNVGSAYFYGLGVPLDYSEASVWYLKAARKGDPTAISNLGTMYMNGYGVSRDPVRAYMWFTIGAHLGDSDARAQSSDVRNRLTTLEIQKALDLVNDQLAKFNPLTTPAQGGTER